MALYIKEHHIYVQKFSKTVFEDIFFKCFKMSMYRWTEAVTSSRFYNCCVCCVVYLFQGKIVIM